jgi:ribosome recycling factor
MKKKSVKFTPEQRAELVKAIKEIKNEAKKKIDAIDELANDLKSGKITKEKFFKEMNKI